MMLKMTEKEQQEHTHGVKAKAQDFWHHRSRATRIELLLLVAVFLFFEFVIPLALGSQYSKRFFEKHLSDALRYPVTFERINTNIFGRPMLWVGGFKIDDHEGHPFFRGEDVRLELSPWALLRGRIVLKVIRVVNGDFLAARLPDGRWNVADLVAAGNDPDQGIDLGRAGVEMKNVVATFKDQSLALPLLQRVRLKDFSISSLDIRRKTRLRVDAIDEDHPESSLRVDGNFAVFIPDDLSTLSGYLNVTLNHFNLQALNPYLSSAKLPVRGLEGFYYLEMKMEGQGSSPTSIHMRSKVDQLRAAVEDSPNASPGDATRPVNRPPLKGSNRWIDFKSGSLEGRLELATDEIRFYKLQGELAFARFQTSGRVLNLHNSSPRLETTLSSEDFELVDPIRSLIDVGLDEFERGIFAGLSGTAQAQLIWTGKLEDPTFDWRGDLKKGQYQDGTLNFQLKDIAAVMRSSGTKTLIESLRAQIFNSPLHASGTVDEKDRVDLNVSVSMLPFVKFYPYLKDLRSQGRLKFAPWVDRVPSVTGQGQANLRIVGDVEDPDVTGTVALTNTRMQLAGISAPVEITKGQILLENNAIIAHQISGSWGDSPFEFEAMFDPQDFSLLAGHLGSTHLNLKAYDEFTAAQWIDRVELPVLGQIKQADGVAGLQWDYRRGLLRRRIERAQQEVGASRGDGGIPGPVDPVPIRGRNPEPQFSLYVHNANGLFSNVALPLKNFSGGLFYMRGLLKFDHLHGAVGDSTISLNGDIDQLGDLHEQWNLAAEANAVFPQGAELLPSDWKNRIAARGEFPIRAELHGERQEDLQIRADVGLPATSEWTVANLFEKPADVSSQLSLEGVWKGRTFNLSNGTFLLGDLPFALHGKLELSDSGGAHISFTTTMDKFVPVPTLLKFIKLPVTAVSIPGGSASGSITLEGELRDPSMKASLRLADVSVAGMPWGQTNLTGDLVAGPEGVSAKDFLAIVKNVPMRVTGTLNWAGPKPGLVAEVNNLNLDALVMTLAHMSSEAGSQQPSVSGKPMNIDVSASSGVFFHQPIKKFQARGTWNGGILQMDPVEVTAGDSLSTARILWDSRTNQQHLVFQSKDVPMGTFLDEVMDLKIPVEGKLSVDADLAVRNPDPNNLMASLEGNAHFEASKGTLQHSGLPQRLLSMAMLVHEGLIGFNLGRIFQTIDPPQFKGFKHWSADVTFSSEGAARLERSEFKSDLFNLAATGTIDAKTENIVINVKGSLPEIPRSSNLLAQVFGRISVRELYRNARDFALLITGQRKKIKPRRYNFEFKLTGKLEGVKSIEDFHFVN